MMKQSFVQSAAIKKMYKSSREETERMNRIIRQCTEKVKITLIDVGMVIKLDESDRINFVNLMKSVIEGESEKCAQLIYNLSNFQGQKLLNAPLFDSYLAELKNLFSVINSQSFQQMENLDLFVGMLNIIRDNQMKLDGKFATLLTNMIVLQAIAKQIDPSIQILKCAVPFFGYVEDQQDKEMKIKSSKIKSQLLSKVAL